MNNLQQQIEKIMSDHPDLFPTESKFWTYLRGALRRSLWSKSPMKLRFKSSTSSPPPEDYTGRGRKGHYCALTGEWVAVSKSEVDHIEGNVSLSCEEDIIPFIVHLLASGEDQLQVVDKEAHKIKSYAERMGITFEQATVEKRIIEMMKDKNKVNKLLDSHSLPCNNDLARKESLRKLIGEGKA